MSSSDDERRERETRLLEEALRAELAERPELLPPWQRYPEGERFSSFWRMGQGEWYAMIFARWLEPLSREERALYFRRHGPVPTEWADWVASAIYGWGGDEDDDALLSQVRRLEREHGLVDAAAWEGRRSD